MLVQIVGWVGAAMVILAYVLVSSDKLEGESRTYQALNLFGAIGVGISVFEQRAWPALSIQVVWGIVAMVALFRSFGAAESKR